MSMEDIQRLVNHLENQRIKLAMHNEELRQKQQRIEEKQKLLAAEFNHRIRNTLTLALSLARQTLRRSDKLETFWQGYEARLIALAQLHSLLTQHSWNFILCEELLMLSLDPYQNTTGRQFFLEGVPVFLSASYAQSLHMLFHELATNAAKYGAFSTTEGSVLVQWQVESQDDGPMLKYRWRETNGPNVTPPQQKGFGSELMEQLIMYELNGNIAFDFQPSGLICEISVPFGTGIRAHP